MTSPASAVGSLALPLLAGPTGAPVQDVVVAGVADYLAFWLNYTLSDALDAGTDTRAEALRGGRRLAVPDVNRFGWDPSIRLIRSRPTGSAMPLPALYCWTGPSKWIQWSTIQTVRARKINVAWVLDELAIPDKNKPLVDWQLPDSKVNDPLANAMGLLNAADATMFRACVAGAHPQYQLGAMDAGLPISLALDLHGQGLTYDGGKVGFMKPSQTPPSIAQQNNVALSSMPIERSYPAIVGTFSVMELVGVDSLTDADATPDMLMHINTGEPPLDVLDRVLEQPDGTQLFDADP